MGDKTHGEVTEYKLRRTRRRIRGTPDRPRLCVRKSRKHITVQIIDHLSGNIIASASTMSPEIRPAVNGKKNMGACRAVGKLIAERGKSKGVGAVQFDRSGYIYHGKIAALADAAREGGLLF